MGDDNMNVGIGYDAAREYLDRRTAVSSLMARITAAMRRQLLSGEPLAKRIGYGRNVTASELVKMAERLQHKFRTYGDPDDLVDAINFLAMAWDVRRRGKSNRKRKLYGRRRYKTGRAYRKSEEAGLE